MELLANLPHSLLFPDYAADSAPGTASPKNGIQIPLKSWAATPFSSKRGSPCPSSRSSTGRKPSVKMPWPKCFGPMAFVAHAAKALLMDSFTGAGSGGISAGNAATKPQ